MEGARPADADDLAGLTRLAEQAIAELRELRGGEVFVADRGGAAGVTQRLKEAVDDPAQLVLAGTIDEVVVGYARVATRVLPDGRRLGVIDDLFVEDEARAVGVGEALMDRVAAWCREQGCFGVDAVALPGHRASKNFFEESGLTARLLVMHRRLDG